MLYSNCEEKFHPGHRWKEDKFFLIEGAWPGEEEEVRSEGRMGLEGLEGPEPPEISLQAIAGLRTPTKHASLGTT